jgi:hypothetical protein
VFLSSLSSMDHGSWIPSSSVDTRWIWPTHLVRFSIVLADLDRLWVGSSAPYLQQEDARSGETNRNMEEVCSSMSLWSFWLFQLYFGMVRSPKVVLDWSCIGLLIVGSEPWLGFVSGYSPSFLDLVLLVCTNIRQLWLGNCWWFSRDWVFKDQSIRPVTLGLGSLCSAFG